jgi:hypothetical protein
MAVEFVPAEFVHTLVRRIGDARAEALRGFEKMPAPGEPGEAHYWESVLETNAAQVLRVLEHTHLETGFAVRYRFYEMRGGDLRVRPFVTRRDADVTAFKRLLDWHAAPDAGAVGAGRDAELLYRHFRYQRAAPGVFEYWFALQEIWASSRWAHSRVIASADDLGRLTSEPEWTVVHMAEHCAPAVVLAEESSHLAVLVYSPIGRQTVTLEQISIGPDQVIRYGEPIVVATGPRGWIL